MIEALPVGAVRCVGCKQYDRFLVRYPKALIAYKAEGLDMNGVVIYTPVSSEGSMWTLKDVKEHVKCGHCQADVPLYLFSRTEYIR